MEHNYFVCYISISFNELILFDIKTALILIQNEKKNIG